MQSFGEKIKQLRESKGLLLRQVAAALEVDQAIISKYEKGNRKPNRNQVLAFAKFFNTNEDDLLIAWLSDKVVFELEDEELAMKAMQLAERKIKYQKNKK